MFIHSGPSGPAGPSGGVGLSGPSGAVGGRGKNIGDSTRSHVTNKFLNILLTYFMFSFVSLNQNFLYIFISTYGETLLNVPRC